MNSFLPFVEGEWPAELKAPLERLGPILVTPAAISTWRPLQYIVLLDQGTDVDQATRILDDGATQVVIPMTVAKDVIDFLPRHRLLLLLDARNVNAVTDRIRNGVSGVILQTTSPDLQLLSSIQTFFGKDQPIRIWPSSQPTLSTVRELSRQSSSLVIPSICLSLSSSTGPQLGISELFLASVVSDRPDGLFPTVVSSFSNGGKTLGLVYSSKESVEKAVLTGQGWYQSRKHGLWRKGETSGATQQVISIRSDCDSDALEFQVIQQDPGFCHDGTPSCFGGFSGVARLEQTLLQRKKTAPAGSYTQRLFEDPSLLRSKILEEAEELASATTKKEVAFEAADLLYFALARCISAGVSFADVEASLDAKSLKVTRRPGNAKPANGSDPTPSQAPATITPAAKETSDDIRMRHANLANSTPEERSELLRRPVLRSNEMIAKVKPIIEGVRSGGDNALREFTAKFDKVDLDQNIVRAPFPPDAMKLESSVRDAICCAYDNVRKFHAAQMEEKPLVVETMPGVVCSRFARPIARVGLYVPGGTAILPSTALMLGVPAQVAGCKEIVIAVPPRPDGSISPEVLFVAHLVGASAVLKAGGAQAIAAMAYGTETVPKVDKIFGPGNQWVTAAKMAVQNDTDALVSIDMPAGPSEVLVIADHTAVPSFVAADLLSQAEHGIDSQVVLIAVGLDKERLIEIERELDVQAKALPRVDIVKQSIAKSLVVETSTLQDAMDFSNDYAPEHLILHLENAHEVVKLVENAGSVFVGPWSPESCGDYASGTNHTLPTNGYARQFSGVNTLSFVKHITSQQITQEGLQKLGPVVVTLAECEGLEAHANAVRVRLSHDTKA